MTAVADRGGGVVERRCAGGSRRRDHRHDRLVGLVPSADGGPSFALGVNDHGAVVGGANDASTGRAVVRP
ncbi:hypothetical protein [Lentzea sp. NEAU-D7]|uniref:hypothetical protein n=1 Tax=Lentzea sp. NEAU-D7 TaxID=2994667 RepID=UPI00224B5E52|nr:hypothetical protein [Lentzea sp. NEAU-D7]MCX2951501.1 hypothetical protein [Lentzea sp. NEAU-D7]